MWVAAAIGTAGCRLLGKGKRGTGGGSGEIYGRRKKEGERENRREWEGREDNSSSVLVVVMV